MTPLELLTRADAYLTQAIERVNAVEATNTITDAARGDWVSLRRNIESAQADVATARRGPLPVT